MRILIINFLRLGDILMMAPIVNSLRKKYPDSEIHHFGFREFQVACEVMDQIDCWHFVSQGDLQRVTRDSQDGLLAPIDIIRSKCDGLKETGFDLVVNLSHTTFSALCAGLIEGQTTIGACIQGRDLNFSSDLFRALNEQQSLERYHYLDWFRLGMGVDQEPPDWTFSSHDNTINGQASEDGLLEIGRKNYLFQVLSSDEKKSWSRKKWLELFRMIRRREPLAELKMVCAPFERKFLESLSQESGVSILGVGLKEAYRFVQKTDVFVTLDTSIKHLANDSNCMVIELSLGSSDFRKQSIYRSGSVILTPADNCYPCAPKSICPKIQRSCSMGIRPSDVMAALDHLEGKAVGSFLCRAFLTTSDNLWKYQEISSHERAKLEEHKSRSQISKNHKEA